MAPINLTEGVIHDNTFKRCQMFDIKVRKHLSSDAVLPVGEAGTHPPHKHREGGGEGGGGTERKKPLSV